MHQMTTALQLCKHQTSQSVRLHRAQTAQHIAIIMHSFGGDRTDFDLYIGTNSKIKICLIVAII